MKQLYYNLTNFRIDKTLTKQKKKKKITKIIFFQTVVMKKLYVLVT